MTNEQTQLLLMRGSIASLPEDQQTQVKELAARIREIVASREDLGMIALALVGAEISVQP